VGQIVTYGATGSPDWQIVDAVPDGLGGTTATVTHEGLGITFTLPAEGRHMVANAVAALAVAELCGIPTAAATAALAGFSAPEGRGAAVRLGPAEQPLLLIDQSYNANSASMAAALEVFARQKPAGGRKVLVLGDMLELGAAAPGLHAALKEPVLQSGAERIYLVGRDMAALADALGPASVTGYGQAVGDLEAAVLGGLAYGDAVMVKGSNGVQLAGLVKKIRARFG
jgi:UDP-N-acetylmuramoyl-tripeptide--D-alanyl-D-alanine ligase